jgi:hypothetical protein
VALGEREGKKKKGEGKLKKGKGKKTAQMNFQPQTSPILQ